MDYIYYLFVFVLLFVLQLLYFQLADRYNIIDKPNERSSHTKVTLRGGGVVFYLGALLFFSLEGFQYPWFFTGLTLISGISFADDVKPRSSKLRLLVHFVAMTLMFYQLQVFSMPWYYWVLAYILCVGILNAYNFMDGINGITGAYSMSVMGVFWYINNEIVYFVDNELIYIVLMSLLVFNFFNFRKKASCFAGDVGSISIAFIVLYMLGLLVVRTGDFTYIGLLAVYGVDTVLTIIHRIKLKENIFQPHRKHLFQLMANELKIPHLVVSFFYAFCQLLVSVGLILFHASAIIYIVAVVFVLSLVYVLVKNKYYHLHK